MPLDSFINTLRRRLGHTKSRNDRSRSSQKPIGQQGNHDYFNNARDFVINQPHSVDQKNYINNILSIENAVFEFLQPYSTPDAAMDSSARYPPPRCHPHTRVSIGNKLEEWVHKEEQQQHNVMWVRGSAGTGKSAVAQSFAERCAEQGLLGASYFFSKTAQRNKLEAVIPTLVYQLAVAMPEYKSLVARELANDPQLMQKAPPVLFRRLIVKPVSALDRHRRIVIIMDGLDECDGQNAQLDILDMITEPFRSTPQIYILKGRVDLVIDAECRDDVERYMKGRIVEIKAKYWDVKPSNWPSVAQLTALFDVVAGLFVLASTILNHLDDSKRADPSGQFNNLMAFLCAARNVGSGNPLGSLDLLYLRILGDIPPDVFPTTWRILAHYTHAPWPFANPRSIQLVCNFLHIDQQVFYRAMRGLHSVVDIPEPSDASRVQLQFYSASCQDFLLDVNRSGSFALEKQRALLQNVKLAFFWYNVDITLYHGGDERVSNDPEHRHDSLPGLTWISEGNERDISKHITNFSRYSCFKLLPALPWTNVDEELLSQIYNADFGHFTLYWFEFSCELVLQGDIILLVQLLILIYPNRQDPSNKIFRTEASSATDLLLLNYFNIIIKNGVAEPASRPLAWRSRRFGYTRQYFLLGCGAKSVIIWLTQYGIETSMHTLGSDRQPSEAQISQYQARLEQIGWKGEEVARQASLMRTGR